MAQHGNVPSCRATGLFGLVVGAASLISLNPALAYTADQQQACTGDALRLCSSDVPDVDRITACMVRNRTQLSPECRIYFREQEPARSVTTQTAIPTPTARGEKSKTKKSRRNRKSSASRA